MCESSIAFRLDPRADERPAARRGGRRQRQRARQRRGRRGRRLYCHATRTTGPGSSDRSGRASETARRGAARDAPSEHTGWVGSRRVVAEEAAAQWVSPSLRTPAPKLLVNLAGGPLDTARVARHGRPRRERGATTTKRRIVRGAALRRTSLAYPPYRMRSARTPSPPRSPAAFAVRARLV